MFFEQKNRAVKKQDKTKQNVIKSGRMSVGVAMSVLMLKKIFARGSHLFWTRMLPNGRYRRFRNKESF